eukprot:315953_1
MIDNHNQMISCANNIIICCIRITQKKDSISDRFRDHGMHRNQDPILLKTQIPKNTLGMTQINKYWYYEIEIGFNINNLPKNNRSNSNLYGDNGYLVENMYGIWSLLYELYMHKNLYMEFTGTSNNPSISCNELILECSRQTSINEYGTVFANIVNNNKYEILSIGYNISDNNIFIHYISWTGSILILSILLLCIGALIFVSKSNTTKKIILFLHNIIL